MHATVVTSRTRQVRRKLLEAEPREAEPDAASRPRPCAIIRTWRAPCWRISARREEQGEGEVIAAAPTEVAKGATQFCEGSEVQQCERTL